MIHCWPDIKCCYVNAIDFICIQHQQLYIMSRDNRNGHCTMQDLTKLVPESLLLQSVTRPGTIEEGQKQ